MTDKRLASADGALTSLPPRQLLDRLVSDPNAPALVQRMSSLTLHRLVSAVGRGDAAEIIAMAAPEQVRELLDLEVWTGDRVDLPEALDWVHLLCTQLPKEIGASHLRKLDVELLGFVLLRHLRIYLTEEVEVPDEPEGTILQSPDGWFTFEVLAPDEATVEQVSDVLDQLYRLDHQEARSLLQNLMWELPTELEELSYRWRNGRLQDLGFADPHEALMVYAYLAPDSVSDQEGTADRRLVSDPDPVGEEPGLVAADQALDSFLNRCLASITDAAELQRLSQALMLLGNRTLAADRVSPSDTDAARESLERMHWRVSLGLEHLSGGEPERGAAVLSGVALLRIGRLGHSLALNLRRQLWPLARDGQLGSAPRKTDLLDASLRRRVDALLALRPELWDDELGAPRPFRSRADLLQGTELVQRVVALTELAQQMDLPRPLPAGLTYGDLYRTLLVNHLLQREPHAAVDAAALTRFLRQFARDGRLGPHVLQAAQRSMPPDGGDAHLELLQGWVQQLETEVATIDPDNLDLRFVGGLYLER